MPASADDMVEQAFDPKHQDHLARAIEKLSPEEAQYFLDKLERAIRKRKVQLTGYLAAMIVWLVGMVVALYVYGSAAEGVFVGWVFIVPFLAVAIILIAFGRMSERVGRGVLPTASVRGEIKSGEIVTRAPDSAKSAKPAKSTDG